MELKKEQNGSAEKTKVNSLNSAKDFTLDILIVILVGLIVASVYLRHM
jgi:hypothetical protein